MSFYRQMLKKLLRASLEIDPKAVIAEVSAAWRVFFTRLAALTVRDLP
jgi:hypothetical protein